MDIIESFASQYELALLDYSRSGVSSDQSLFYNNMHLNAEGANKFSLKLAQDIYLLNR
ncbi:hypothetical protein [Nonlabens xiamenensis]|uniref:hypothetical protein n=1 Tax=Nonlabens xiamenensis TaxID=2341043 RepID=UPI0013DDC9DE|nr:hypothetical protein [Nonlabens xiamenensis]